MPEDKAYQQWEKYYESALENTKKVKRGSSKQSTLIEVSAQHPLVNGIKPNAEFSARLDFAIDLYNKLISNGQAVKIYVPGSKHKFNETTDLISLSHAGTNYLLEHYILDDNILDVKDALKYSNLNGVYCSEDECKTAYDLFKNESYTKLVCICSPGQLMRKYLYYIKLGIVPDVYSIPCDSMFHNPVEEFFINIPKVINNNSEQIENVRVTRQC